MAVQLNETLKELLIPITTSFSFAETQSGNITQPMAGGRDRRIVVNPSPYNIITQFDVIANEKEYRAFIDFYVNDLMRGTQNFLWNLSLSPLTQITVARFDISSIPYSVRAFTGTDSLTYYTISMNLECVEISLELPADIIALLDEISYEDLLEILRLLMEANTLLSGINNNIEVGIRRLICR